MDLTPLRELADRWREEAERYEVAGSNATPGQRGIVHQCPGCGGGMGEHEELCGSCRYTDGIMKRRHLCNAKQGGAK